MFNRYQPQVYIVLALAVAVVGVEAWKWALS